MAIKLKQKYDSVSSLDVYVFEIWLKLHLDYYKNLLQNTSDVIRCFTFTKIFASSPSCQPDKSSTDDRAPNILVLKLEGTGLGLSAFPLLYIYRSFR